MSQGVITMNQLGRRGRFGNQLIQYFFLKTYARTHDLEVQAPPWIGSDLFGCCDPPITRSLPAFHEHHDLDLLRMMIPRRAEPLRHVDLIGNFQYHTSYYAPHREYIRSLFQPTPPIAAVLTPALERLRAGGRTVVGLHIRRGDYGYSIFYRAPASWYLEWLDAVWDSFERPVLYIATDEPETVIPEFSRYHPVTAQDLGVLLPQAPYYVDFYILAHADVLAIPNSTFSFVAAMLNERLRLAVRSHLSDPLEHPPFRPFDPWNDSVLTTTEHVEQYPQIAGIRRPRWQGWAKERYRRITYHLEGQWQQQQIQPPPQDWEKLLGFAPGFEFIALNKLWPDRLRLETLHSCDFFVGVTGARVFDAILGEVPIFLIGYQQPLHDLYTQRDSDRAILCTDTADFIFKARCFLGLNEPPGPTVERR